MQLISQSSDSKKEMSGRVKPPVNTICGMIEYMARRLRTCSRRKLYQGFPRVGGGSRRLKYLGFPKTL